eukprot:TRINITY_DN9085_c0_g1_i1.p1 TRINITY_DN9085_c0_g1~~TRINITY_DN9085_c0_g1_i1.p1  ORF type:complete len:284 (-),score=84.79 TRINITY_DN9085_c0_g1_i1:113-931(-)
MAAAPYERIRVEKTLPGVLEIVLNRGQKLNTMDMQFFEEIGRAADQIEEDDEVRVGLIWAEGKVFTAGLDLKAMSSLGGDGENEPHGKLYHHILSLQQNFQKLHTCRKPIIVAIHSHCIGGGVDLALAADIRFCTSDTTFSVKETKIAIVADLGTLQRLTRAVGPAMAREMAFTGERIDSKAALNCGLVTRVYPNQEELLKAARVVAGQIAENSPLVVQGTKKVLNYSDEHSIADGLEYVALWNSAFLKSDDLVEAVSAFMEKRPPKYKSKL